MAPLLPPVSAARPVMTTNKAASSIEIVPRRVPVFLGGTPFRFYWLHCFRQLAPIKKVALPHTTRKKNALFHDKLRACIDIKQYIIVGRDCSPNGLRGLSGNSSTSDGPIASAFLRQTNTAVSHRKPNKTASSNKIIH